MSTRKLLRWVAISMLTAGLVIGGCHAAPDDAEGQAEELSDPVRRENAIANLRTIVTKVLADHGGDRENPEVKAVVDVIVDPLTKTYVENTQDTRNGLAILEILGELRDPRAVPALLKALEWRREVSEEHAIRAAQTAEVLELPEDKKNEIAQALGRALERVTDNRPVDNRMRVEMLQALGALRSRGASAVLQRIVLNQSESQNFLINRLACEQLGKLGDPESVPTLIKALYLFGANNPGMRMNDVAAIALVRVGRPALAPLLETLRGRNEEVNAIAQAYINAVRAVDANAASQMNVRQTVSSEAGTALGALGLPDALGPLVEETQSDDMTRKFNAAIALVRLNVSAGEATRIREVLKRVYGELPSGLEGTAVRGQLLAAMRHTYDEGLMSFFLEQARNKDLHPDVRIGAVRSFALLATRPESNQLRELIQREPTSEDGGYRENFAETNPMLEASTACDANLTCWIGKLADANGAVVRKAAYMIGRFGAGNAQAIQALVGQLGHTEIEVRFAVVHALDHVATHGSPEAVARIEALHTEEEGRQVWTQFSLEALPIEARLRARQ